MGIPNLFMSLVRMNPVLRRYASRHVGYCFKQFAEQVQRSPAFSHPQLKSQFNTGWEVHMTGYPAPTMSALASERLQKLGDQAPGISVAEADVVLEGMNIPAKRGWLGHLVQLISY
jgi:hypothetical protein